MAPLRAVVFDLGQTLWDFAPTQNSWRLSVLRLHERLAAAGGAVPSPRALDKALGATSQRWFQEWDSDRLEQPPSDRFLSETLASLGIEPGDGLVTDLTAILFGRERDMPVLEPDTLVALATLANRGLALGCVTNTVLLEEGIQDIVERLGLRRYLRAVVASSAMGYHKPHASLFLRALGDLGVVPEEALFVGDRLHDDVRGAKDLGMRAVLTHQYRQEPLDSATVPPDAVITRLGDLPRTLEELGLL